MCKPWCDPFASTWEHKCGFEDCNGCPECFVEPPPPSPPSPVPDPPPPSPSPPELYAGGGCGFYTTGGKGGNAGNRHFYGIDRDLSRDGGGTISQPIIGKPVAGRDPPASTYFSIDIFSDNAAWDAYAQHLDPLNDQLTDGEAVLYYQLSYDATGSGATSAVVTNARCAEMCERWSACVTYEYFRYDGSKPRGTTNADGTTSNPATDADKLMRCELWVHPDTEAEVSASKGNKPEDVWCGAAGGGMHDGANNVQNWPDLEGKPDVPWPPTSGRRLASTRKRALSTIEQIACNNLKNEMNGRWGVPDECFVSYYNLEDHNANPPISRDARSIGIDPATGNWKGSYMCVLVPWAPPPAAPPPPPPPEHYWVTEVSITVLGSAVTRRRLDASIPEGALLDAVKAVVLSVAPNALVTFVSVGQMLTPPEPPAPPPPSPSPPSPAPAPPPQIGRAHV